MLEYLKKLIYLAKKNDIELVLMFSPFHNFFLSALKKDEEYFKCNRDDKKTNVNN